MSGSHAIKVLVRCRPLSEAECKGRHPTVVTCNSRERQVTVHSEVRGQDTKKTYTFDSVFGEFSQQESVFEDISGIIDEVLEGFNCTVFAYGQTGTGKTYTMQGPVLNGDRNVDCGIIPRSINTIFDRLQAKDVNECVVHVSCLEIYNEEILDLLSDSNESDLRIFDDVVKGVFVSNLEEIIVVDPNDIFTVLTRCWDRRKTAETKMNAASSRSHTIFTVKVHTKETTVDGESIIKIGKLNLVDLAGSECVGKSEAVGQRAKEAGNINRSLLTLGRVINALVQGQRHIPYRESKLTRLLQESLGGRAKTILIATISPSQRALEETLKTLEYAHTAKNILNRPEVNQKVTQKAFVRDLQLNMSMIKKQLEAQRAKSGVYLPPDQYDALQAELAANRAGLERQTDQIESLRQELHTVTESNERLRQDVATQKEAHATQVKGLQDELDRTHASWRADTDRLGQQVRTLSEELEGARDAVARRDRALLAQAEAVADCRTTCTAHVVDVRKSLDDFLALHSNRTKIAVDQARAWAGTVGQAARALHEGIGQTAGTLLHDLQVLFAYLESVTDPSADGVLSVNVAEIRAQTDALRQRLTVFQADAGAACDARSAQLQADLRAFGVLLQTETDADLVHVTELIDDMRQKTGTLADAWTAVDAAVGAVSELHDTALGQFRTALIESFIGQERAVRAQCDQLAEQLTELVRAGAGAIVEHLGQRASAADTHLEAMGGDLATAFGALRLQLKTTIGVDADQRHDEGRRVEQVLERAKTTRASLTSAVDAIPTSCEAIGVVVNQFTEDVHPEVDRVRSAAARMEAPIQTIRESAATHRTGAEARVQDLRQTLGGHVADTARTCKDQIALALGAQQQFESELSYREQHHQAVGEIGSRIEALAQRPPYSSPVKPPVLGRSKTTTPSSSCPPSPIKVPSGHTGASRLKRPRPLSREFDDVENERPLNTL